MNYRFGKIHSARFRGAFGLSLLMSLGSMAYAQTVSVDPTGTANGTTIFNNLQTAITSFATGGTNAGNGAANIINVRNDHGPVTGSVVAICSTANPAPTAGTGTVNIEENITIQGVDGSGNPALAVFAGTALDSTQQNIRNNAFPRFAWTQPVNLTINKIAFIPAAVSQATYGESFLALKAPAQAGANPIITIDGCVFTANDGAGNPITTTGAPADDDKIDLPNVIALPQDGSRASTAIWAFSRGERGDLTLNIKDSVFASMAPRASGSTPRFEVIKAWVSGTAGPDLMSCFVNFQEGNVIANIDGNVGQIGWGCFVTMKGTASKPNIVRDFKRSSVPAVFWLYFANDSSQQPVGAEVEYTKFYNCPSPVISEGGVVGTRLKAYIKSVKNCKFVNCGDALTVGSGAALDTGGIITANLDVDNCVFHNTGIGADPGSIYGTSTFARNLNVTNSVFSDSDANDIAIVCNSTAGAWNVASSILSLSGTYPLGAATGGTGTVLTLDGSVNNNPVTYVNTTDVYSSDFYVVAGSNVNDWAIY